MDGIMENNIRDKLIQFGKYFSEHPSPQSFADAILTHFNVTEKKPREYWIVGGVALTSKPNDGFDEFIHVREIFPESKE